MLQKKDSAVVLKGEDGSVKMGNAVSLNRYETIPEHLLYQSKMDTMNHDSEMSEQVGIGGLNKPSAVEIQLEEAEHAPDPGPADPV